MGEPSGERERELTPDRALRKMREEIRRRGAVYVYSSPSGKRVRLTARSLRRAMRLPLLGSIIHPTSATCVNTSSFSAARSFFIAQSAMKSGQSSRNSGRGLASNMRGSLLGSARRLKARVSRWIRRRQTVARAARCRAPRTVGNIVQPICSTWVSVTPPSQP